MDILIKNMEMPKDDILRIEICPDGQVNRIIGWALSEPKKAKAVELPKHGELIEREKLIEDSLKAEAFLPNNEIVEWFQQKISSAPTVLEAST